MKLSNASEGARRLSRLVRAANGVVRWAQMHGFHASVVSRWLSGSRAPGREMATKLQRDFGIPVEAWGENVKEDESCSE